MLHSTVRFCQVIIITLSLTASVLNPITEDSLSFHSDVGNCQNHLRDFSEDFEQ